MWVFTNKGAVSIVQDWKTKDKMWVRSRLKEHLLYFVGNSVGVKKRIQHTPDNDYAFRVSMTRREVGACMVAMTADIDYDNFKNSIKDNKYHGACSKIWTALLDACNTGCYRAKKLLSSKKDRWDAEEYFRKQDDYYNDVFKGDDHVGRDAMLY
jgi:hypothetical protein